MKSFFPFFGAVGLVLCACDIADEDRCPDGMVWVAQYKSCQLVSDGQDTDDPGDGGADGGGVSGMGEECMTDADCEEYEADYCALDPFAPDDPGYCTVYDCEPGACPGDYVCCDCTGVGLEAPFCLQPADAEAAAGYGCTCS
jgi:hypothetical protein